VTPAEYLASAFVVLVCVLTRMRSWTVVALAMSFLIVHAVWAVTFAGPREMLPVEIMCDYAVIVAVLVKAAPIGCIEREIKRAPGHWGAFVYALKRCQGSWTDLSHTDQIVLALFAPAWAAYAIQMGDWTRYWVLYGIGIAQFIVAGADAFSTRHRGRGTKADATPAEPLLRWGLAHEC
jgi:hypothetical protein